MLMSKSNSTKNTSMNLTANFYATEKFTFGATYGMAFVLGPPLAGIVMVALSWRWIFWLNIPLGAAALWMAQRTLDAFARMSPLEQAQVRQWLRTLGGERLLDLDIPRLSIHGVRVALESHVPDQTTPSSSLHARS